ncbi:DNA polymerase [Caulobacter segnis]
MLARMENNGVRVDPEALRRLSNEFSMRMAEFEARATELVGRPFNLGSPKQIGDVLFGEMQMKGGKDRHRPMVDRQRRAGEPGAGP